MNRFLALLVAALLAACAATGVKVTDRQLGALHKGETTVEQAVAALGAATTRSRSTDGSVTLQYVYAEATVRAASFIPIVGAFAGGTDVRTNMATLRFDPRGKLIDVSTSESQYGTGLGISAGAVDPARVPQPKQ